MSVRFTPRFERVHAVLLRLACTLLLAAVAHAHAALRDGEPPPYIPTPQIVVDRMLGLARVGSGDVVVDLGSGDGRIVITAAQRFGARGLGVDLYDHLVQLARKKAAAAGVADKARFVQQDALRTDLSTASVLTLYLGPELNEKLMPRILDTMRPGSRVVSHDFPISVWQPDAVERFDVPEKNFGRGGESTIMLWIVPAAAAGRWRAQIALPDGSRTEEFSIGQNFQKVEGVVHRGNASPALKNATLEGPRLRFETPDGQAYDASVEGDAMKGVVRIVQRSETRTVVFTARRIGARPDLP